VLGSVAFEFLVRCFGMTSRFFFIFTIFALFFGGLSYYFLTSVSPFDLDKMQQLAEENVIEEEEWEQLDFQIEYLIERNIILEYLSSDAYIGIVSVALTLVFAFAAIHIVIDKLLFKKFFEKPSLFNALRRGLFIGGTLLAVLYAKLYGMDYYTIAAIPAFVFVVELWISLYIVNAVRKKFKKIKEISSGENKDSTKMQTSSREGVY
jgi:hypothetical protein